MLLLRPDTLRHVPGNQEKGLPPLELSQAHRELHRKAAAVSAEVFGLIEQRLGLIGEEDNILLEELGRLMLESIVGNRGFSLEDVDFSQIADVDQLLQVMINFEMDTLEFYRLFHTMIGNERERRQLGRIIADEDEHILKLLTCRDKNLACHKS